MLKNILVIAAMVYGATVAIVAMSDGPVGIVAIIGGVLLGIAYVATSSYGRAPRVRR